MNGQPSTSIITVSYNSAAAIADCWSHFNPEWAEWVMVDNFSSDESAAVAAALGAKVVQLSRNLGFSRANNIGAAHSSGDVLIFCNPDVVVSEDGIRQLAKRARDAAVIVAPQLLNPDGTEQENGRGAPYPHRKLRHMFGRSPDPKYARIARPGSFVPVVWVMGAAVAMSRATFERVGRWNPKYFVYYEDADLSLRALSKSVPTLVDGGVRWKHGWARATARGFSFRAWVYEVRSGLRFYATNWYCLLPIGHQGRKLRAADKLTVA